MGEDETDGCANASKHFKIKLISDNNLYSKI